MGRNCIAHDCKNTFTVSFFQLFKRDYVKVLVRMNTNNVLMFFLRELKANKCNEL